MTYLIGERYRSLLEAPLTMLGADILWLPDNPALDPRVAAHADLSVLFPDPATAIAAESMYPLLVKELTKRGYQVIASEKQGERYPLDAGLCICSTGRYIIYNPETADRNAVRRLVGARIAVRQGYTRCSVCVVSKEAIITADDAIASSASKCGLDVLHIQPGHIVLDGYDTGFIGGAAWELNGSVMAFTGSLEQHPDKDRILMFLQKYGLDPILLTDKPIFDIGGAVALP